MRKTSTLRNYCARLVALLVAVSDAVVAAQSAPERPQANKPSMKHRDFIFVGQKIVIPS